MTQTRWEYKMIWLDMAWTANSLAEKTEAHLNELGQEGWELVSFYERMLILKRPSA